MFNGSAREALDFHGVGITTVDIFGDTLLHAAVQRDADQLVVFSLEEAPMLTLKIAMATHHF